MTLALRILTLAWLVCSTFSMSEAGDSDDAMKFALEGDYFNALRLAREAVDKEPENADAQGYLAEIEFQMTHLKASRAAVEKALELAPERWGPRGSETLAQIEFLEGNDDKVRPLLDKASDGWVKRDIIKLMDPPGLKVKRTKHYIVYADEGMVAKGGLDATAQLMEIVHKSYSKVLPFDVDPMLSRVYVFSTTASYQAFNVKMSGDPGANSLGYFSPNHRILVIDADPQHHEMVYGGITTDSMDTMFHEGFHQFARMHAPDIAIWFNEGMAEYFGPSKLVKSNRLSVGSYVKEDPAGYYTRYAMIQECIENSSYLPLGQFFSQPIEAFNGPDDDLGSRNYAQAWSFMHFLLHSKPMRSSGPKACKKYFKLLREGHPVAKAHAESFGKLDLRAVEKAWVEYTKNLD